MDRLKLIFVSSVFEFFGTLFYVLLGCASTLTFYPDHPASVESIALCFGISYACLVKMVAPFSGGHLNPAITVAMMMRRKISIPRALCYLAFQFGGGICGSAILYFITPLEARAVLGANQLGLGVQQSCGFALEIVMTFLLVYTVLMCTDEDSGLMDSVAAMWSGMVIVACHYSGFQFTSCGINPARSLAPAVMTGIWTDQWIYWLGPMVGGLLASIVHYVSKNFPVLTDEILTIRGEAIDLPEVVARQSELGIEPVVMEKQGPASPSLLRAAVPTEMKTYL